MSSNNPRRLPPQNGLFQEVTTRGKLVLRLMGDGRVNFLLKLIPFASLAYFIFPDIMPGPIDDAVLIWLSTYLFVELCPPEVVQYHINDLSGFPPAQQPPAEPQGDVIDGEVIDVVDESHPE